MFKNIKKRDGRVVPFETERITAAIFRAGSGKDQRKCRNCDNKVRSGVKILRSLILEEIK